MISLLVAEQSLADWLWIIAYACIFLVTASAAIAALWFASRREKGTSWEAIGFVIVACGALAVSTAHDVLARLNSDLNDDFAVRDAGAVLEVLARAQDHGCVEPIEAAATSYRAEHRLRRSVLRQLQAQVGDCVAESQKRTAVAQLRGEDAPAKANVSLLDIHVLTPFTRAENKP
jgi:hypothetical protein